MRRSFIKILIRILNLDFYLIGHVSNIPVMPFLTGISDNTQSKSCMLSLTEYFWDFQNNALWATLKHALLQKNGWWLYYIARYNILTFTVLILHNWDSLGNNYHLMSQQQKVCYILQKNFHWNSNFAKFIFQLLQISLDFPIFQPMITCIM